MADIAETVRRSDNKSLMEKFLANCSLEQRVLCRKVENLARKVVSAKWRVVFLGACLKDIYIYILADPANVVLPYKLF